MAKNIFVFLKKNVVLTVSWIFAFLSMFFCTPSLDYFEYINFNVLIILFCMMIVVEAFSQIGVFKTIASFLLKKVNNTRQLTFYFVFICFFISMLITNDVALITFVPFTIMVLKISGFEKNILWVVVLETIAANLGSMMTPIGNPQNLFLYSVSEMNIYEFFEIIAPYTVVSFVLLFLCCLFTKKEDLKNSDEFNKIVFQKDFRLFIYTGIFLLCILTVLRLVDYYILLFIVILFTALFFRKLFLKVDYILLLTFIGFFIFVGNIGKIYQVEEFIKNIFMGNEVIVSIGISQVISNVPAALLISGFSDNYREIIIGVNIGGLGTLIASMASLISYKFYMGMENSNGKKYFIVFTITNLIFLFILYLFFVLF